MKQIWLVEKDEFGDGWVPIRSYESEEMARTVVLFARHIETSETVKYNYRPLPFYDKDALGAIINENS